jgi:ribosomal protein S18 acetylase RimI-like enzyme
VNIWNNKESSALSARLCELCVLTCRLRRKDRKGDAKCATLFISTSKILCVLRGTLRSRGAKKLRRRLREKVVHVHRIFQLESTMIKLDDIKIRTELKPGDIGYVIYLHGLLYKNEFGYGIEFETYVAEGLLEFYREYDQQKDRVWICEHENKIVGFLLLMHRGEAAQLRYFILQPEYRGIGLGNKLMSLYMAFLKKKRYKYTYLLTTAELTTSAHLYKKFGFALTEEKPSNAFGKPVVQQRYDLRLE